MESSFTQIFSSYQGNKEEIIPILQDVQETNSYISEDAMSRIAKFVGVPESTVYGVATFYAQFRFEPRGRQHVMVCRGTACHVNGAPRILEEIETQLGIEDGETTKDMEYSLETVACIGACSLSPCIMVNGEVKAKLTPKKVKKLFKRKGK